MTSWAEQLLAALRLIDEVEPSPPTLLLAAIQNVDDPIAAISSGQDLFAAFEAEYGFLSHIRSSGQPLSDAQVRQWARLLRWLVDTLCAWRFSDDPAFRSVAAVFVFSASSGLGMVLWDALPDSVGTNRDLLESLARVIGATKVQFSIPEAGVVPIWEQEEAQAFQRADEAGDWVTLGEKWRQFEGIAVPLLFQKQAVQCLYCYSPDHLVQGLKEISQIVVASRIANALSDDQAFHLACKSDNPYIQFAFCFRALSGRLGGGPRTPEADRWLTAVLKEVASEPPRWRAWMQVFNRYPQRFPKLQPALGFFLAGASDDAIRAYVYSIQLYAGPPQIGGNRNCVAACLEAFRQAANADRRAKLWALAYERWCAWAFDREDPNSHLTSISWSELDFALVGYALECMTCDERNTALLDSRQQLAMLDTRWFGSLDHCLAEWNRLLSRFQPYARAISIAETADFWLTETTIYLPFEDTPYLKLMYSVR